METTGIYRWGRLPVFGCCRTRTGGPCPTEIRDIRFLLKKRFDTIFLFFFLFLYFFENYTGSNRKYYAWKFGFLPIVFQFTIYGNIF